MGSSLNNQNEDYGDVHETYTPPYDVVCPQLSGKKPNLHQSACDSRLARLNVPKYCRTCKGRVDKPKVKCAPVIRTGFTVITPSAYLCHCGERKEKGFTFCPKCKEKKEAGRKLQRIECNKKYLRSAPKYCGICKKALEDKKHKYCPKCKEEAKLMQRTRENEQRVLLRKQQREMK